MINRANKVIILFSLILLAFVIFNMVNLLSVLPEDVPNQNEIFTDIEYNEIYCEFIALNQNQITVIIDEQEESFPIHSPVKFIGISKGSDIVLLVPTSESEKVAIKIENESILN